MNNNKNCSRRLSGCNVQLFSRYTRERIFSHSESMLKIKNVFFENYFMYF